MYPLLSEENHILSYTCCDVFLLFQFDFEDDNKGDLFGGGGDGEVVAGVGLHGPPPPSSISSLLPPLVDTAVTERGQSMPSFIIE